MRKDPGSVKWRLGFRRSSSESARIQGRRDPFRTNNTGDGILMGFFLLESHST